RLQKSSEDRRGLFPLAGLALELLLAGAREAVELRPAVVVRHAPLGGDVALLLELEERGIERSVVDGEQLPARLLDAPRDAVPMLRTHRFERLQHHQGEGALPDVVLFTHACS